MNDQTLQELLLNMMTQWQAFTAAPRQNLGDYEQGFVAGFEAAAQELSILISQTIPESVKDRDLEILPAEEESAEKLDWEYLYVRFEQNAAGNWYLKDVNGFWHSPWKTTPTFGEAVEQLRNQEGWRLVSFAKGIHVFRRPNR